MNETASQNAAFDATPVDELTFRQALSELDVIVAKLEGNTLELEDSLLGYERGVALLASLQKRLTDAQQKVEVLMDQLDEEPDDATRDATLS
ncbi:MAG TPA: exodeoxyribonuclease VII small subunit [Candidatus Aphodovivens avistercoris]|nr:exodeoxyribonuclease VII small subunit [Candidatus Aphodovivens avistercoris]